MEQGIKIERKKDSKGRTIFTCSAYGNYGEFFSQIEAANFGEACAEVWRKKHDQDKASN